MMMFIGVSLPLSRVDSPVLVLRRTVKAIELKVRRLGAVDHIMSRTRRYDDARNGAEIYSLQ